MHEPTVDGTRAVRRRDQRTYNMYVLGSAQFNSVAEAHVHYPLHRVGMALRQSKPTSAHSGRLPVL
jgi:hypothetical protein